MSLSDKETWVSGEVIRLHTCDNCGLLIDGIPQVYWPDNDFTLCMVCVINLANNGSDKPELKASLKKTIPDNIKWDIWERDNFTCQYCGSRKRLSIDHILPESIGGEMLPSNLVTACRKCNTKKGARTPEEAEMKLKYDPR